nr:MAG: nonstructural polyprotein [Astroviridae sp.]
MARTEGLSKICAPSGTVALLTLMKTQYGTSEKWKKLMKMDAVYLKNTHLAIGYESGIYYKFSAVKNLDKGGWDVTLAETFDVTQEDMDILAAHGALEMRIKAFAAQSSARAEEALRLREKIETLSGQIDNYRFQLDHLKKENAYLRTQYRDNREVVEKCEVTARRSNWTAFLVVAALAFMMLLCPVHGVEIDYEHRVKTDCTEYVSGCYYVAEFGTRELSYIEFSNICFGQTRTLVGRNQLNKTRIQMECEEHMSKIATVTTWVAEYCRSHIANRLHDATCEQKTIYQQMQYYYYEQMAVLTSIDFKSVEWMAHLLVMAIMVWRTDPRKTGLLCILGVILRVPGLIQSVLICWVPWYTYVAFLICHCVKDYKATVVFSHWVFSVVYAFLYKTSMQEVSLAVLMSLLLPFITIGTELIIAYKINIVYQVVAMVLTLSLTVATAYVGSTVTITEPDGTVKKYKRFDTLAASVKNTVLRAQNAIRGVIPQIPDKADHIVRVDSDVGQGVGFRYMNNICTIGHVAGPGKVVKLTWREITVIAHEVKRMTLPECCDELVFYKLPGEFQALKPFRLSKIDGSDYMSLYAFDPQGKEPVSYTGWCMKDGYWLSNSFETQPGNSGGPYVDRFGRLVAIHLGTQGVVAQGYLLQHILNVKPEVVQQEAKIVQNQNLADVADDLLAKLIEGTKKSHAQLTTEIEKMAAAVTKIGQLEEALTKMVAVNTDLVARIDQLQKRVDDQHYRIMDLEAPLLELEKRKKKRANPNRAKFMKMRVLTEEQYREMMENGWSREQIQEAVNSLREQAWQNYLIDYEDYEDEMADEELQAELDHYLMQQESAKVVDGKKVVTVEQDVVAMAKREILQEQRRKPFQKRKPQRPRRQAHKKWQRDEQDQEKSQEVQKEEPKNSSAGKEGTSQ